MGRADAEIPEKSHSSALVPSLAFTVCCTGLLLLLAAEYAKNECMSSPFKASPDWHMSKLTKPFQTHDASIVFSNAAVCAAPNPLKKEGIYACFPTKIQTLWWKLSFPFKNRDINVFLVKKRENRACVMRHEQKHLLSTSHKQR